MRAPLAEGSAVVRFHHVFKVYRIVDTGVVALAGVDFEIAEGEFLSLVGPSGSGKSTVLNLVGGLDRASAGEVEVEGRDLGRLDEAELTAHRRDRIGFVWQGTARNLVPYLSLRENVGLPLIATGRGGSLRRRRVGELLEVVGLADRAGHTPGQLSGGEQQRAAVAVALANLPAILLADEPTAELDSESAERVLSAFRDVNREFGVTVAMVTHDLLAARRADRTIRIRDGRIAPDTHSLEPLSAEGSVELPGPAVDALAGSELEVEVSDGEVRIRRRSEPARRLPSVARSAEPSPEPPDAPDAPEPPDAPSGPDPYSEFRRPD
ncbi:MAG: ABC transporter ATP-binding protein [Actinobacteria bacterium]|nr:ABC transporter ATP-binding protein [Actinomycetota bacterium]